VCRPGHPVCREQTVYRTEPYNCSRIERVAVGEETDYSVDGNVEVRLNGPAPAGLSVRGEAVDLTLSGSRLGIREVARASGVLFLVEKSVDVRIRREDGGPSRPGLKEMNAVVTLTPISAQAALSAVNGGVKSLQLSRHQISASIGRVVLEDMLAIHVELKKARLLSDKPIVDRELSPDEYTLVDQGGRTQVLVDLDRIRLDNEIEKGKYNVVLTVIARSRAGLPILGSESLEIEAQGKLKNKKL
jgi:hypothetical protein